MIERYLDGVTRVRAGLLPKQHAERLRRKLEAEVRSKGCPHRNTENCELLTVALREGKQCPWCLRGLEHEVELKRIGATPRKPFGTVKQRAEAVRGNPNVGARPNESRSRGASVQRAGASE